MILRELLILLHYIIEVLELDEWFSLMLQNMYMIDIEMIILTLKNIDCLQHF
jgi:hypothetical protein